MKKRKKQPNWIFIIIGFFMISGAFFFSLKKLSTTIVPMFKSETNSSELTKKEFLDEIVPIAKELQQGYGVRPSIILSQAILESNWGISELAKTYKNLFGVKAYGNQQGIELDTKEFVDEKWITIKGNFRVYSSWKDSLEEHSLLLVNGVSWNPKKYEKVLTAPDYKVASQELQKAGYATDPNYAQKIQEVIESYNLTKYD